MPESSGAEADVGRWLALLRDGSEEEQQHARTELGLILEARGLLDEAAEAYERNVQAGVSDRRPYERLAALARARGDVAGEARALRALADLLARPPAVAQPSSPVSEPEEPAVDEEPASAEAAIAADDAAAMQETAPPETEAPDPAHPADAATVAPSDPPEVAGLAGEAGVMEPAPEKPAKPRAHKREDEDPGIALHHVLEMHPEEAHQHAERRSSTLATGMSRTLVTLAMLVPVLVVLATALFWPGIPNVIEPRPPTGALPVTADLSPPPTVELHLIAGTPSPLPSPFVTLTPTSSPIPALTPTPLAARCTDAALRFPETRDPEAAVRAAYGEYLSRQGVAANASSSLFVALGEAYAARHDEVVAGWMAVTLQREQRALPAFPLADYVASDVVVAVGPGEYQLRATISPQGWTEMRSWPAESCEGAFMHRPANAHWVDLMQASVGDITWALPTRPPAR